MKTAKDLSDGHLWYSVLSRPPSSTFTCVQRVSCCFSLLLCTMLTSIMFYGIPTDPSEQTMDLGTACSHYNSVHSRKKKRPAFCLWCMPFQKDFLWYIYIYSVNYRNSFFIMYMHIHCDLFSLSLLPGHFEFTWQQFMIGVQSSLIMFPVNILIVSIFRNTQTRETSCCKCNTEKVHACEQEKTSQAPSSQTSTTNLNTNVTLDNVIKVCHVLCNAVTAHKW